MIGVLIAPLTYMVGPIALQFPQWYLVLLAVSILLALHEESARPPVLRPAGDGRGRDGGAWRAGRRSGSSQRRPRCLMAGVP
jgi:hypothetical protein